MTRHWYRLCPVCGQGRLFVCRRCDTGVLFLLCEECFCRFDSPDDAVDGANCREGFGVASDRADAAAIAAGGWSGYGFNTEPD